MNQPQINNSCPMANFRIDDNNGVRHCGSCNRTIIDFSNMSPQEIANHFTNNKTACGIFNSDQVIVPNHGFAYQAKYSLLVLISVIGFNVSPLKAQNTQHPTDTINESGHPYVKESNNERYSEPPNLESSLSDIEITNKKKKGFLKRIFTRKPKNVYRITGGVSF